MAIVKHQGRTKFMWLPWTTANTAAAHSLVTLHSGKLISSRAGSAVAEIAGVLKHAIASTDTEYTTQSNVEVEVPTELNVVWKCDVDKTAALTSSDHGEYMDLTSAATAYGTHVDTSQSDEDPFLCVGFISATQGYFILNIGAAGSDKA